MAVTININGLSLVHKGSNGMATATMPDVCKTPSPAGPVPIPYPNIAMSKDLVKGTTTITVDGGNMAANAGSELMLSTGDEAGTAGGVASSSFIKEATWMSHSFDVMLEGKGACRLTDKLFMNHMNTVCMGGWIQNYLQKNRKMSNEDACKALLEVIMDLIDGAGRQQDGRGLDGPNGRIEQNTRGGGLGPAGAPNAPRTHLPSKDFPQGANHWETHDKAIERQQDDLRKKLKELDDDCGGGPRSMRKDIKRARDIAERPRPTKEEWEGEPWVPEPAPLSAPSEMTTGQKVVIVAAVLLIAGGVIGAFFTGGGSLVAAAAGVAIIVGPGAAEGGPGTGAVEGA